MTSRRRVLKGAGLLGFLPLTESSSSANSTFGIYSRLGIRPVINCRGTHTVLSASKIWPELHMAMAQASREYVMLEELHDKVGARLAELTGSEACA
jgi:L-seryl-tRNA(Ser) seleniumtransferase